MAEQIGRGVYWFCGMLCLLVGIIGVVVPLLPTTPFVLLAAFCFSRSSERLHQYLLNHRVFGKLIRDWEAYGVIPLRAKCLASSMMLIMVSYPLFFREFHYGLKLLVVATIAASLCYIWSRPSEPTAVPCRSRIGSSG
ncbi:YbaN family protein [Pontibacter sp. JAM-7]|uniref:YbaN family protein n=1 Tax=Pontibacter sp. JAM-7 TaxID=3366581 RepID=UPI003AF969DC